jgi:hypothetical protein
VTACPAVERVFLCFHSYFGRYLVGPWPWNGQVLHGILFDVYFGVGLSCNPETEGPAEGFVVVKVTLGYVGCRGRGFTLRDEALPISVSETGGSV